MTKSDDFDDDFGNVWDGDSFRKFFEDQRNMELRLREYIKNMIESLKKGQLQGKSEIVPIDKPGVTGFIFRGVFGSPEALEGEGKIPELGRREIKSKEGFALPEIGKEELREPIIEEFEDENEHVVLVELPGVEEQDIKVEIGSGSIEIGALNFKPIRIDLPANSDISKMAKNYKNGVLEIKVPIQPNFGKDDNVRIGVA